MDAKDSGKIESGARAHEAKPMPETAKPSGMKEVKKKASDVMKSDGNEAAEGSEGAETGNGNVSEEASEDKNQASQGGGAKAFSADEIEAIRAKLLAALPPQEVMIKQIRKKLVRDEGALQTKRKKLMKHSDKNPYEVTLVVRQLRKIQEYFFLLAHATYEMVKHLWLKIVHGV